METTLVLGGPGCGKTTRLLEILEHEMSVNKVEPRKIAFVSFTTAAADEAKERAGLKFKIPMSQFIHFRTIHSLAFRALNVSRDSVLGEGDLENLQELSGEIITGDIDLEEGFSGTMHPGDQMMQMIQFHKSTKLPLEDVYEIFVDETIKFDLWRLKRFYKYVEQYKETNVKIDFGDMLLRYPSEAVPLKIDVAIIDEAQDLTKAQWDVCNFAFQNSHRTYIGGDDDQAIYKWAGADIETFRNLKFDKKEVLPVSYRLPVEVFNTAQHIVDRINDRYEKNFKPTKRSGSVEIIRNMEELDLSKGSWFLLARNGYLLKRFAGFVKTKGYPYSLKSYSSINLKDVNAIFTWEKLRRGDNVDGQELISTLILTRYKKECEFLSEDNSYKKDYLEFLPQELPPWFDILRINKNKKQYYAMCLRNGQPLSKEPRIHINTIHGVKGREAENVVILTSISARTSVGMRKDPNSEHRVFYVGVTRAIERLFILLPTFDTEEYRI